MRYNRASIESSLHAAKRYAAKHDCLAYVYANAYGFIVDHRPPPFGQQHYVVTAGGTVHYRECESALKYTEGDNLRAGLP